MPKKATVLTKKTVEQYCNTLPRSKDGKQLNYKFYADGGASGLYLKVYSNSLGTGTWFYRQQATANYSHFEKKLGCFPSLSLTEARKEAFKIKGQFLSNPSVFNNCKESLTLAEAANAWFLHSKQTNHYKRSDSYVSEKQRMERYVLQYIGDRPIIKIDRATLIKILKPAWNKPRTIKFLLTTLRHIFRFAIHLGYIDIPSLNILDLRVLEIDLGRLSNDVQHFGALPFKQIPEFMSVLRKSDDIRSYAFEFQILCALRPTNVRTLRWHQIHLEESPYVFFSKKDMKVSMNGNFRVPLSKRCLEILKKMEQYRRIDLPADQQYVFPSPYENYARTWSLTRWFMFWNKLHIERKKVNGVGWIDPLATEVLISDNPSANIKPVKITPHGTARTSFRMWASSHPEFRHKPIEYCLHHKVGTDVENAYDRSDYFEERQKILEKWAEFCCSLKD